MAAQHQTPKCSYTQGALQLFRALLLNVQCGGHLDGWKKKNDSDLFSLAPLIDNIQCAVVLFLSFSFPPVDFRFACLLCRKKKKN